MAMLAFDEAILGHAVRLDDHQVVLKSSIKKVTITNIITSYLGSRGQTNVA